MDPSNPRNTGDGNKIFLVILLILTIFIVVLLLLLASGLMPIGETKKSTAISCGDDNPCTTDYADASGACKHDAVTGPKLSCSGPAGLCEVHTCSAGSCTVEVIDNCCGNGECELPETASTCPIDCGGGGTITVDIGGNKYKEYNDSGQACQPNSGQSDGALCTCEENDCTDGVDNDNDGLIDCRDPDCDCLESEDCPPCSNTCEDSQAPACRGECPDDEECTLVAGATAAGAGYCECQPKQERVCEDSVRQQCTGTCPPGQECESYTPVSANIPSCRCVPQQVTCADSYSMQCTGTCKSGTRCVRTLWNTCECVQIECEDADAPDCKGVCPRGESCGYLGNGTCGCEAADCEDIDGDTENECAPGDCPNGKECVPVDSGCSCEVRCEDETDANQCPDAWCPGDEVCVPYYYGYIMGNNPTGNNIVNPLATITTPTCICRPQCGDIEVTPNTYSLCYDGWCDSGYCSYDARTNSCGCTTYIT